MLKFYAYKGCDTCRKARKDLETRGIPFEKIAIRETPPSKAELQTMLAAYEGNLKKLFNTSGGDYREQKIGDKLPLMSDAQAIDLLASNGNLIKRPFMIDPAKGFCQVGFKATAG